MHGKHLCGYWATTAQCLLISSVKQSYVYTTGETRNSDLRNFVLAKASFSWDSHGLLWARDLYGFTQFLATYLASIKNKK